MKGLSLATAGAFMLLETPIANAGFLFSDFRPRSYKQGVDVSIEVGDLVSKKTTTAHEFYSLNWCASRMRGYKGDEEVPDQTEFKYGVDMYE